MLIFDPTEDGNVINFQWYGYRPLNLNKIDRITWLNDSAWLREMPKTFFKTPKKTSPNP